ncbi:hypothetical protein ACWEKR_02200 [Nocardia sp. NPDC004573]
MTTHGFGSGDEAPIRVKSMPPTNSHDVARVDDRRHMSASN